MAGLAHADVGNVSEAVKAKYYAVNTDLAIETAAKAKEQGVRQFVFMSYDQSMSRYDFDYIVADLKTSIERTEG